MSPPTLRPLPSECITKPSSRSRYLRLLAFNSDLDLKKVEDRFRLLKQRLRELRKPKVEEVQEIPTKEADTKEIEVVVKKKIAKTFLLKFMIKKEPGSPKGMFDLITP